jgi:cobalt-zinc-cadmium efflux system protein
MDLSTDQLETHETTSGKRHSIRLSWALGLTVGFLILEVIGAIWTGSLALLADAGHMLTDVAGICLSLFAIWFASKPPTPSNTYGYVRLEILAALANGVLLFSMATFILYEAYRRIWSPPEVLPGPMLAIAVVGLGVNLTSMWLLHKGSDESLNLRGAYFEVLGDAIASLGVIVAAFTIQFTGWTLVDPVISGAIGLFILPRTWNLIKQAVQVLMEGVPLHLDVREIV